MAAFLMACPMCFGAADSDQVYAAKVGVLVMLGFIARTWAKRARALEQAGQL